MTNGNHANHSDSEIGDLEEMAIEFAHFEDEQARKAWYAAQDEANN